MTRTETIRSQFTQTFTNMRTRINSLSGTTTIEQWYHVDIVFVSVFFLSGITLHVSRKREVKYGDLEYAETDYINNLVGHMKPDKKAFEELERSGKEAIDAENFSQGEKKILGTVIYYLPCPHVI